jgi:hypothetical protein
MNIHKKTPYKTPPHSRAALDVMRAVASNHQDREEIKRIEAAFRAEDVAEFDPEFDREMRALAAQLNAPAKGRPR